MMRLLHRGKAHGANQSQYRETGAAVMTELEKQRMQEMIRRLNEASEAYYGGRDEIMSNFECLLTKREQTSTHLKLLMT